MKTIFRRGHGDSKHKHSHGSSSSSSSSPGSSSSSSSSHASAPMNKHLAASGGKGPVLSTPAGTAVQHPPPEHSAPSPPSAIQPGAVFGVSLTEVCEREGTPLPRVATECLAYLREKGLQTEGIFRIPGNTLHVENLKKYYNGEGDYSLAKCNDAHAAAGVFKLYLRELPDPLLTHRFYDTFIAVQKNPDWEYRMTNLRKLVYALPPHHKNLLRELCKFLLQVARNDSVNKMSLPNLAIVFGPNILRPKHESMLRMIEDARHVNGVLLNLCKEYAFLVTNTSMVPKLSPDIPLTDCSSIYESDEEEAGAAPSGMALNFQPSRRKKDRGVMQIDASQLANLADQLKDEDGAGGGGSVKEYLQQTHGRKRVTEDAAGGTSPAISVTCESDTPDTPEKGGAIGNGAAEVSAGEDDKKESEKSRKKAEKAEKAEMEEIFNEGIELERALECCNSMLDRLRALGGRSGDIDAMSASQRADEKAAVKRVLRIFDNEFKAKNGALPNKAEKEVLRPLYMHYRTLNKALGSAEKAGEPKSPRSSSPATSSKSSTSSDVPDAKKYKALKKEKRKLQLKLHEYQNEFFKKHGRKVQYLEDRLPVQEEYERYKELKSILAGMEGGTKDKHKAEDKDDAAD
eukprot:TRINITY_DN2471_c6_g1_i1.p1 TRINITY_DN2471_c6_g1~~TRINITY_DN2471_c6_g1_i1.p1  ORF type:complete len:629 (+),score=207.09 TRINITY_DN2471_c6_g1_i1:355-2241(+)